MRQQQEMEEDQRWLEKEERFLVTEARWVLSLLEPWGARCPSRVHLIQSRSVCSLRLVAVGGLLFSTDFFWMNF